MLVGLVITYIYEMTPQNHQNSKKKNNGGGRADMARHLHKGYDIKRAHDQSESDAEKAQRSRCDRYEELIHAEL